MEPLKKTKQILSAGEIRSLQDEKNEIESTIKDLEGGTGDGTRGSSINKATLSRQAQKLQESIDAGAPGRLKGLEKDKLAKRAKELEDSFLRGMPTDDQMRRPVKYPGIVRKNLEWQRRNSKAIKEWKNIQRQLEPGDTMAPSVERLRQRGVIAPVS